MEVMVSPVGGPNAAFTEAQPYQRKAVPVVSNKADPSAVYKPRIGGLAPPAMLAHIKQMSEAAKGAQPQYNAMAKQLAALSGPLCPEVLALRMHAGSTQLTSFTSSPMADSLSALFVDTKA
jgi:hypothetical protein